MAAVSGRAEGWYALPGSQQFFLASPVFEVLYEGTRGPGKTVSLLMSFVQHVGRGYGRAWRGVLFRRTYPELADVIAKSKEWFKRLIPGADYNEANSTWRFPGGEELLFRQFQKPDDYWKFHGHEYPWVGWEELTTWPDDVGYRRMMSCCRSSRPGLPRMYRATTNPYGPGHNWVKRRFRLPRMRGLVVRTPGEGDRMAIHGRLEENTVLLAADPNYVNTLRGAAANPAQLKAWLEGDWDITAGGMFDDIWDASVHVLDPFPVPTTWAIDRSFDWGSARPFSVGWWAESDGTDVPLPSGRVLRTVRGDLFRIGEWYGCRRAPDGAVTNDGLHMLAGDIARGIVEREAVMGLRGRVQPGPADSSIFDEENGNCIAADMAAAGARWTRADKGPGSRKQGWQEVRTRLAGSKPPRAGGPREHPGLFVFRDCDAWIETVPVLPRDDKDLDDVDTESWDHAGDETRYRVRKVRRAVRRRSM